MARQARAQIDELRPTRDVILDAAERLFAERGYAGVSMRDITAETGLKNQASLYHHFRNKRALYQAVLARGVSQITTLMPEPARSMEIDNNIDRLLDYLGQHPHLARLIQRAALDDSRYLGSTVRKVLNPIYAQGRQALSGADAVWERDEIPHLAAGLYHLIFSYFANAELLAVFIDDPLGPAAVERQRRFLKAAVALLLGVQASAPARQAERV
ncbi:MAG: TetR/AcrR family transcriptional regulator [Chloroflexi bacterium]|nr:TetR/AcrR family transcriptional regulator [Chloroflexota bacterium]